MAFVQLPEKKLSTLGSLLSSRNVDVCLKSETHLYDQGVPQIVIPGYEYAHRKK